MKILYNDRARDATLTDASYGTDFRQLRPASNVQVPGVAVSGAWVFGTESPDSQAVRLRFDAGSAIDWNFVGILGHSGFTDGTTVNIRLGTTLGGAEVYNPSSMTLDSAPEGEMSNFYHHMDATYSARYLQVEVYATSFQAPSIGRIMAGECWDIGAEVNFQIGVKDTGMVNRSVTGVAHPVERDRLKTMDLRFIGIGDQDMIGSASDSHSFRHMDATVGRTGEVCAFIKSDTDYNTQRYGIYGFAETNSPAAVRGNSSSGYVSAKSISIVSAA